MKGKNKKQIRNLILVLGMIFAAMVSISSKNVDAAKQSRKQQTPLKVHFIDVGAGDAALIQYGSGNTAQYALIDAGPVYYERTNKQRIDTSDRVRQYLKKQGISHLKFVLLTHPHQDHIGGMIKILDDPSIQIDTIYGNDTNLQLLQSSDDKNQQTAQTAAMKEYRDNEGVYETVIEKMTQRMDQGTLRYVVPKPGQKVRIGNAVLTFYGVINNQYSYARKGDLNYRQVNKYSIVSKLSYGSNTFLMTGDAQKETIELLIKRGYNLQAQVLKVPHHGMQDILQNTSGVRSDHNTLFQRTKAKISVISNGYDNIYKAPHKKVLQDLSNTDVYDTGRRGTIIISGDGKKLFVKVQKGKGPSQKKVTTGPKNPKIKSSLKGIKTLELKEKDKSKKILKSKKAIRFHFTASYGVSGKKAVRFKIVPVNKKANKYPWIAGEKIEYKKAGQQVRLYVQYTNHAGYQTTRKTNVFTIEKKKQTKKKQTKKKQEKKTKQKKDKKEKEERKENK